MKKHSCGAILYTISNQKIYIILGMEYGDWFPFKGTREKYENNIQTAIREIHEETCGVVNIKYIDLKCNFTTKRKHYHIGLVYVPIENVKKFHENRKAIESTVCNKHSIYLEKTDFGIFELNKISSYKFHSITKIPVSYYLKTLHKIQSNISI
jgi:hypothetical protein